MVGVVGVVGDVLLCFWKQEEEFVLEDVGVEWEQEWSERQNPPCRIDEMFFDLGEQKMMKSRKF